MDTLHTVLRSIRGETKVAPRSSRPCSANSSTTSTASRRKPRAGVKTKSAKAERRRRGK